MTSITKRQRNNRTEFYLRYSSNDKSREKYLGTRLPKNIEQLKRSFEEESYKKEKIPVLEKIQKKYSKIKKTLDPKLIKNEHHEFKINHTFSTQKIEGSTMTLNQTRKLLEQKLSPKDTAIEDILEAKQISKIFEDMLVTKDNISKKLILKWHETLFEKTDANNAGNFRRQDVSSYLGKTEYVLWQDVISDITSLVKWFNKNKTSMNPIELSARFHRRFELIHPFIDGNGRIGRLLMLLILYKNNYPLINILPKEKNTYIKKLEASYLQDDYIIFLKWFVSKYIRDNKKYL